jgi:excisionase family DNA binding protein
MHRTTVYKLVKRKELLAFRVGAEYRFHRADLDEWIEKEEKPRT